MQDYARDELPALGYVARKTTADQPGLEEMAAGRGAQNARVAATNASVRGGNMASNSGALPGSGSFLARVAKPLNLGASGSASGATAGRLNSTGSYLEKQGNIVGSGNKMLNLSNEALVTAGGVQSGVQAAQTQANAQNKSETASISVAALAALA